MNWTKKRKICSDVAFLYERLSRDDDLEGESYSIATQKKLLTKVAKEKGYDIDKPRNLAKSVTVE